MDAKIFLIVLQVVGELHSGVGGNVEERATQSSKHQTVLDCFGGGNADPGMLSEKINLGNTLHVHQHFKGSEKFCSKRIHLTL